MNKKTTQHIAKSTRSLAVTVAQLVLAIILFLFAIDLIGASMNNIGQDVVQSILLATSNPFIGLFIGLLATAIIQSSSTVTAMTVAVVATGYLSLQNAIPIVMGANVGTTLTSTLVSLSFVTNRNEFRKAISAGSIHDIYNIFIVIILFPLEYYYGVLSESAIRLTSLFGGVSGGIQGVSADIGYGSSLLTDVVIDFMPKNVITLILSLVLLFVSIKILSKIIYSRLIGSSKENLKKYVFNNPYKSFGWGTLITAGVQSSSITTSLMVPLVASGRVKLANAFPLIMGANIGTTFTALLAALNKSDAAISLAFVHLLFNLVGVLIFLPFPVLRRIPVKLAYRFGVLTLGSRAVGFSYIIVTFFLLPFTLISLSGSNSQEKVFEFVTESEESTSGKTTVLLNTSNANKKIQYSIFQEKSDVDPSGIRPDTSFTVDPSMSVAVTAMGVVAYDLKNYTYQSSGKIESVKDTANLILEGIEYENIRILNVSFAGDIQMELTIDYINKLVIQTKKFKQGQLVETSKVISVE